VIGRLQLRVQPIVSGSRWDWRTHS
jgi:hypothetical protein